VLKSLEGECLPCLLTVVQEQQMVLLMLLALESVLFEVEQPLLLALK
jgi:hypothetical protein